MDCSSGRVRIGIEAPKDVTILRGELVPFGKMPGEVNQEDRR